MSFLNLKAILSLNGSGFALGLKRAESASKQFAREIKGQFAQAFGAAAITAYAVKVVNMADNIIDLSESLEVSTKSLQEWDYAAKKSGKTIEDVTRFLNQLSITREKALGGDANAKAGLGAFGITDLSMTSDQMARQIASSVAGGNVNRTALNEVGGRGASQLVGLLKSFEDLTAQAHEFGKILTDETLQGVKDLKSEVLLLADSLAGPLAKSISALSDPLREMLAGVTGPIAATAAYLGARSGGASPSEALDAAKNASDSIKSASARRKQASQDAIASRNAAASQVVGDSLGRDVDEEPIQKAANKAAQGVMMNRPALNSWQQLGAAVRFNPNDSGREIAKNTAQTNRQLTKVEQAIQTLSNPNGFGADGGF